MQIVRWAGILALWLVCGQSVAEADNPCADPAMFAESGWQHPAVQDAMDDYLRDHRMRVNWLQEPRPPNAIGRDYYEWLWIDPFGARMKAGLVQRFCGVQPSAGADSGQE